ncbi:hypothetical protein GV829_04695 [Sphingomonas lacunae]|uniref:Uncharacterized protein n=1 Tax=Sphingomonas lacunae TaxID=2698828 RepID=A0A6M4ARZ4_9SPHN|nr:hypothetical protein [Sphingomonas lacunae]QJQ31834.1 hypothetical protein GV829_04695 [Sphingomonas lacunae]
MTLRLRPTPPSPQRLARRQALVTNAAVVQSASIASVATADVGELQEVIAAQAETIATINERLDNADIP